MSVASWVTVSLSSWRAWIEIQSQNHDSSLNMSLSSWRAWIEMPANFAVTLAVPSRSPHGERGLKWCASLGFRRRHGRSPHGERGLKSLATCQIGVVSASLSSWRAWIEISFSALSRWTARSLSSWRAWIEIQRRWRDFPPSAVALLMESVD